MEKAEKIMDREVAWRIFAIEFNMSNLHISEGDERAPNYIITPTGVKCNRLFIVGVVTEVENIGKENNLWRARIADPTGVFTIYAGQYQPEAAIFLSELQVPAYVAIVGKARKYEPEDGSVYVSVRPEELNTADEKLRDMWVLDTAEHTLLRIRTIEDALDSGVSGNELKELLLKRGTNPLLADGAVRAIEHYKNPGKIIEELKNALIHAVETAASERAKTPEQQVEKPGQKEEEIKAAETTSATEIKETEKEPKEVLADIIDKLDTGRGTTYSMVVETAQSAGIGAELVELSIKELMAEGRCYELKIGVLRKVQE
ncbi:MAG: DNA-binding protein [Euryarchaeota archaeon]|nr:DNA-binding protein [Euryarchaeota archaeon]MBU4492269.1 DNA-binding protein [Euryarchaeota archaeon]MCG2727970.1 DNA-binding protein [Candidatus Methanoperedenaceae archaeon]